MLERESPDMCPRPAAHPEVNSFSALDRVDVGHLFYSANDVTFYPWTIIHAPRARSKLETSRRNRPSNALNTTQIVSNLQNPGT